jgi:hypothetical protein
MYRRSNSLERAALTPQVKRVVNQALKARNPFVTITAVKTRAPNRTRNPC